MAADAWVIHEGFKTRMANGTCDLDNDTFKLALYQSTSNAATQSINNQASLTNEVSGNGYTAGGNTLTSVTWADGSPQGQPVFDAADTQFTASGGSIVARFAVIYDDTDASKTVVAHCLLDNTPADITVANGDTLTVQFSASGIFQLS